MEMMLTEYDEKKHHETIREEGREDGHKEGMAEGMAKGMADGAAAGKAEGILEILSDIGAVSVDLRTKIMAEKDLSLLSKWLKLSARSEIASEGWVLPMASKFT